MKLILIGVYLFVVFVLVFIALMFSSKPWPESFFSIYLCGVLVVLGGYFPTLRRKVMSE